VGSTITGPIEIKVGFGKELRNSYVSFFVNNQFRSMTNLAPYSFVWDTTREPNGWHELEAWVVDENSTTYKTRKTRVFVNNPSGQTNRRIITPAPKVSAKPVENPENIAVGAKSGLRNAGGNTTPVGNPVNTATAPSLSGVAVANQVNSVTGATSGLKPGKLETSTVAGAKLMTPALPKIKPIQAPSKAVVKPEVKPVMKIDVPIVKAPVTPVVKADVPIVKAPVTPIVKTDVPIIKPIVKAPVTPAVKIDSPAKMVIKVAPPKVANILPVISMLPVTKGAKVKYSGTFTITLDSKPITFDVQPRVTDGIPLTPIRHLLESAGGEVKWEEASKTMTAFTDGREIYVRIGDKIAKINNLPVEMEIAPFLERGRTMVPLSFVRESLEVEIQFDPKTGHVLITSLKKKS
jgi:hypothetical protein